VLHNTGLELPSAREVEPHATAGAGATEKKELCLCGTTESPAAQCQPC
jgi:hypothetical protein